MTVGNRPTTEPPQTSFAKRQGERRHLDRQLPARTKLRDKLLVANQDDQPARGRGDDLFAEERPAEPAETVVQAEQPAKVALSRAERERYERQRRRFAACGRCGYFVADCLLLVGEGAFQSALLSVRDNWITLDGDETFRRLLVNAYGVELDIDYDYFDGSCPECRRRFVFTDNEDGLTQLKIQP